MIQLDKDCKIYTDNIEENALQTLKTVLSSGAFEETPVRIMPDVHDGKGIVIGFTAPLSNYVNPNHVGVDIGCCIDTWFTNIKMDSIAEDTLKIIEHQVRRSVPFGMNIHHRCVIEKKDFLKFLNNHVESCASAWNRISHKTYSEDDISEFCKRIGTSNKMFWRSLGTVGSGNHFVEFGKHVAPSGQECLNFTIHCGSRNLGVKVAKYHCDIAEKLSTIKSEECQNGLKTLIAKYKESGNLAELENAIQTYKSTWKNNHPEGYLFGQYMNDYLDDMVLATAYSLYNHLTIKTLILKDLERLFPNCCIIDTVRSIHNYIDMSDHIIRKGAIRAYTGQRMVVPFNMRDGIAICEGKSNPEWNYSCSHGAGRKMSRTQAFNSLSMDTFNIQMQGIVSTSVCQETLDEAPDAYKDTQEIIDLIQDTCEIKMIIKPLINLKAK